MMDHPMISTLQTFFMLSMAFTPYVFAFPSSFGAALSLQA
jgi:hypothetical protein